MEEIRKIIHIDMDAFYASVEQRDNPALKGKPVIVGGFPGTRGVVSTCSYEARRFGIHSAMSSDRAYRLCPDAIFINGHYDEYAAVSKQIHAIFLNYTDKVEPLSLDEAYLDVTSNRHGLSSATIIARSIREEILRKTGLTASAGVSFNKFLAKIASEYNKPDGLTVVTPAQASAFIENLDISCFYGIGTVTASKLRQLGINTGKDLKMLSRSYLVSLFGKNGSFYYDIVRGIDTRDVVSQRTCKSIGREITLQNDTLSLNLLSETLSEIVCDVSSILIKKNIKAKTVTLKIKYHDFKQITRSSALTRYTDSSRIILNESIRLLKQTEAGSRQVRLIGISASNFDINQTDILNRQLQLPFSSEEVL